jgi:hypothetical protein
MEGDTGMSNENLFPKGVNRTRQRAVLKYCFRAGRGVSGALSNGLPQIMRALRLGRER